MAFRNAKAIARAVMLGTLGVGLTWTSLAASSAHAATFCVVCDQPQAVYACVLPKDVDLGKNTFARRGMRLACLQGLARAKNHGQCSIRKSERGPCIGERVVLSDLVEAEALRARAEDRTETSGHIGVKPDPAAPKDTASKPKPEGEPRTLVELTERTVDLTNKQIEQAGKTLEEAGGAASTFMRRSWTCVTSLFADC